MIKLERCQRPKSFTTAKENELTTEYITGKNLTPWQTAYIKKAVRKQSHYKCAYCECLGKNPSNKDTSKLPDLHTDHYFLKKVYPYKVVNLDNLLSACPTCNSERKKELDALDEPIIHPVIHNPKEHLGIKNHLFYGKTALGEKTATIFKLKNFREHCLKLMELLFDDNAYYSQLDKLHVICQNYSQETPKTQETRNTITDSLRQIMQQATPTAKYSAYMATHLLQYPAYQDIKTILNQEQLWTNEFIELEKQVSFCALI